MEESEQVSPVALALEHGASTPVEDEQQLQCSPGAVVEFTGASRGRSCWDLGVGSSTDPHGAGD